MTPAERWISQARAAIGQTPGKEVAVIGDDDYPALLAAGLVNAPKQTLWEKDVALLASWGGVSAEDGSILDACRRMFAELKRRGCDGYGATP